MISRRQFCCSSEHALISTQTNNQQYTISKNNYINKWHHGPHNKIYSVPNIIVPATMLPSINGMSGLKSRRSHVWENNRKFRKRQRTDFGGLLFWVISTAYLYSDVVGGLLTLLGVPQPLLALLFRKTGFVLLNRVRSDQPKAIRQLLNHW